MISINTIFSLIIWSAKITDRIRDVTNIRHPNCEFRARFFFSYFIGPAIWYLIRQRKVLKLKINSVMKLNIYISIWKALGSAFLIKKGSGYWRFLEVKFWENSKKLEWGRIVYIFPKWNVEKIEKKIQCKRTRESGFFPFSRFFTSEKNQKTLPDRMIVH